MEWMEGGYWWPTGGPGIPTHAVTQEFLDLLGVPKEQRHSDALYVFETRDDFIVKEGSETKYTTFILREVRRPPGREKPKNDIATLIDGLGSAYDDINRDPNHVLGFLCGCIRVLLERAAKEEDK